MKSLVLITSVINTPHTPLSYCNNRSVYSREERFEQTKKTISSVRNMIPDCIIYLVECSDFTEIERDYFENNCDYVMNLWNQPELHKDIFGISKALGEGTMTIKALEYIINNDIIYDSLIKISGRYWLNDKFIYEKFNNNDMIFKKINNDSNNILTLFYKFPKQYTEILYNFLIDNIENMKNCMGFEILFGLFTKKFDNIIYYDYIGVSGMVAVCANEYYEG